jgi:hypothetical protein
VSEPTLPDKILAIHDRLDDVRIPHAFGGALALAYYAEPRATDDVDVNVFVPPTRFPEVSDALSPLGVGGDVEADALEDEGQCRLWWGRSPIDLFFAYDELHDAMRRGTRTVPFGDEKLPILGPEHLIVCKAVFDRPKDWLDIEQVLVCVAPLDVEDVSAWLGRIVGDRDARARRFEAIAGDVLRAE